MSAFWVLWLPASGGPEVAVLAVLVLLRWEKEAAVGAGKRSRIIKLVLCYLKLQGDAADVLPLAGGGREGRERRGGVLSAAARWCSSYVLASTLGAARSLVFFLEVLPRREGITEELGAGDIKKRCRPPAQDLLAVLFFLAGLGGEGGGGGLGWKVAVSGGGHGEASSPGVLQQRTRGGQVHLASASNGRMAALLDHVLVVLPPGLRPERRIFFDLGKGSIASVAPSGVVPGGGDGSCARRSCICGGEGQGPDPVLTFCPRLATGSGGGDNGRRIGYGGGNSGDDDGDDDDYFEDSEDGDEESGFFRRRIIIQELFKREFVDAVLQEWYKTISNLPAGLRQAHEMGLVSSAQMVQYLSMFGRPTKARYFSRAFPDFFSRGLVGRMLADPSFLHKMTFELLATVSSSVWWEMKNREERFQQEWDLVFLNVFTATVCNLAVFCSLAPCRSYMIQKLPNNIFEKSYPMRQFDLLRRTQSLFSKAAELCLGGLLVGSIQGGLSNVLSAGRERRLSMTVPSISNNALSYGAFYGLYANLRYQMLCGLERSMANHFDVLGVTIFFSTAVRLMNIQIGELSRRAWLGEGADLLNSDNLLRTYNGPAAELAIDQQQPGWFMSKNAIVSGLELLGVKNGAPEDAPPKRRRKRLVQKK